MKHRIKEMIAERGLLQREVADRLGMNRVSLNHIINGQPSWPTLEKILEVLHAEPWELFYTREELIDLAYRETKKMTEA